jgi:putative endonuclease
MVAYVYILSSLKGTMYVGVTSNLERRMFEHKTGALAGFTKNYKVDLLVHYEEFETIEEAILREKQIKGWRRDKKDALVQARNPKLEDLSKGWFED